MAKAMKVGKPKIRLDLTRHEAKFLSYVLMNTICWADSDHSAESIYQALEAVDIIDPDGKFRHEAYDSDMFVVSAR